MYKINEIRERKMQEERKWNEELDRKKEIMEKRR